MFYNFSIVWHRATQEMEKAYLENLHRPITIPTWWLRELQFSQKPNQILGRRIFQDRWTPSTLKNVNSSHVFWLLFLDGYTEKET